MASVKESDGVHDEYSSDIVEFVSVDVRPLQGMRFLQLKNPWSHLRWRGRYSERDEKNWTPELLKYLNFDPKTAQKFDNGIPS